MCNFMSVVVARIFLENVPYLKWRVVIVYSNVWRKAKVLNNGGERLFW